MTRRTGFRPLMAIALGCIVSGCATSSDVFAGHQADMAQRALEEANADRRDCPVVIANDTDQHLDVGYTAAGMRSEVGVVPAGQRTSLHVLCEAGSVNGFAVVTMEGMYSGQRQFRARARLDRTKVAMLRFTDLHAVR